MAIDGPGASGKTTAARLVAARLGYLYVDTGATYRALTLKVLRLGTPLAAGSLSSLAVSTCVSLGVSAEGSSLVFLDGQDVTSAIRSPAVTAWVSAVSADPDVRRAMAGLQRELAAGGRVVMEGRDIGTVVLPGAATKVFLTAARWERARRRARDLRLAGHEAGVLGQYFALRRRDGLDRTRADSPLRIAPGAVLIDTTLLGPDEVAECIVALHQRGPGGERVS